MYRLSIIYVVVRLVKKSTYWSKIEILGKNRRFGQKIEIQ